jgi:hypothetical protein
VEVAVEEESELNQLNRKTPFLQNELPREEAAVAEPPRRRSGPRTRAGKQRSRLNATTHGVFAQTPVLPLVENEDDWLRLRQDVIDWFQLDGSSRSHSASASPCSSGASRG